jgi:hypothetical protein
MKPYKVYIDVTNRYSLEIHADSQDDAEAQAEKLTFFQIEAGGNHEEAVGMEVVDIEPLFPPDDEDESVVQEAIEVEEDEDGE